jgi:DNA-binding Xre family transcriptional regulator
MRLHTVIKLRTGLSGAPSDQHRARSGSQAQIEAFQRVPIGSVECYKRGMDTSETRAANHTSPRSGGVYLRVAALCRERGIISTRGRTRGRPSIRGLMERTGLAPKQAQAILRRPWDLEHISLRTIEQLCRGLGCEPGELFGWDGALPGRPKVHAVPTNNPPVRDREQRWNEQWERDYGQAAPEEDDEYVLPDELDWEPPAAPAWQDSRSWPRSRSAPEPPDPRAFYQPGMWD